MNWKKRYEGIMVGDTVYHETCTDYLYRVTDINEGMIRVYDIKNRTEMAGTYPIKEFTKMLR